MSSEIERRKNATLQRIGRNVVIFSRLEYQLITLVKNTRVSGPRSTFSEPNATKAKKIPNRSLGRLAEELWRNLFTEPPLAVDSESVNETWVTHSLRLELEKPDQKRWKRSLDSLVTSRNNLIHKKLPKFDFNSVDACEALDRELDKQYEELGEHIEEFNNLARGFQEMQRELAEALQTGNFNIINE